MKIDIQDTKQIIKEWNKLNKKYQSLTKNIDVMNYSEEGALLEEMEMIESACVAKHILSNEANNTEAQGSIEQVITNNNIKDLKKDLSKNNDAALMVLKAKLSRIMAPTNKKIYDEIIQKTSGLPEEIDSQGRNDRESFLEHHIIPFISEIFVQTICDRLGNPLNIYVAANLRAFFITPLKMSIKQNFGEDIERSDAEYLISSYRKTYSYEMSELLKGNSDPLKDRLYGRGINQPDSITEDFCAIIADVFTDNVRSCHLEIDNLLIT